MILTSDYHTHTVFSHGEGTILENAMVGAKMGLKEIGISDHGFSHPAFGLKIRNVKKMVGLCSEATNITGVKTLLGIESNVTGIDGSVDLKPKNYDYFDVFLTGIHMFILYKPNTVFSLGLSNFFNSIKSVPKPSKRLVDLNTKTLINVVKKNPVDAITHLNYRSYSNAVEVAKVCADYGTYIELNSKKVHLSDEELYQVCKTGVNFIINSDAHTPSRVGEISLVEKMLERVEVPTSRIHNVDGRLPDFRFQRFKSQAGR